MLRRKLEHTHGVEGERALHCEVIKKILGKARRNSSLPVPAGDAKNPVALRTDLR
jgi:hypothetical protein